LEPGRTDLIQWSALLLTLLVAGVTDLKNRKIPNWLTMGSTLAAVTHAGMIAGWSGAGSSLLGALLGLILYFPIFVPGWLGAGDVKLLMAVGAWGGAGFVVDAAVLSIFVGAVLGVFGLVLRGTFFDFCRRFWVFVRAIAYRELEVVAFRADQNFKLPFAIPMALAVAGRILGYLPAVISGGVAWLH